MKTLNQRMKSIGVKALVIGSCLTFITVNAAFASPADIAPLPEIHYEDGADMSGTSPALPPETQMDDGYASDALKEKHHEIDHYVFEQHQGDFSEQGFTVTHTGPLNETIEIGISPYDEHKAQYLYGVFGDELVNVVEGTQAHTMVMPASPMDTPVSSTDGQQNGTLDTPSDANAYTEPYNADSNFTTMDEGALEATVQTIALNEPIKTKPSNLLLTVSVIGMLLLSGGAAFILRKTRLTRQEK